ncbi:class I SAM-dependent methyltransferase [Pararhizobium antarcticum]|nr:methyltransferase domain-containing protein [Pararhizobium antarcticum]
MQRIRHVATFTREWLRAPLQTASVVPSSLSLARAMVEGLDLQDATVLELGPGTGAFTEYLVGMSAGPSQIYAVESNPAFAELMQARFATVQTFTVDACRMRSVLPCSPRSVKAVLCGLPLLSMSLSSVHRIMKSAFDLIRDDGEFRCFTYGPRCPIPFAVHERLLIESARVRFCPANFPPATVYRVFRA